MRKYVTACQKPPITSQIHLTAHRGLDFLLNVPVALVVFLILANVIDSPRNWHAHCRSAQSCKFTATHATQQLMLFQNHLPNKRHIGKQDPYCAVTLNGEKRRTKAIRKGGQHPEWDEEIRFTIFEDVDDVLARTAKGDKTPPLPPSKDVKQSKQIKGGKVMKLACYADDPREPELIGECDVDLSEALTKGETDGEPCCIITHSLTHELQDWFTLMNKDKFAGKVYLELTFWSNVCEPLSTSRESLLIVPQGTSSGKEN